MASLIQIPSSKGFFWEEMANEQSLAQFVELLIPKEAKPKQALEAEKPNSKVEKLKEA